MISSFSQYLIEEESTVYFTFGRMNPPTIGHGKLLDKLASKSGRNPYKIFLSQSQDSKKNPLTYTDKIKHVRKMFPKHGRQVMIDKKVRTALEAVVSLYNQGIKNITMIVGDDRVREFNVLLNKYNGQKSRHGFYNFKKIDVVSAGQRDPDSEGAEGASATKQRQSASKNDFVSFSQGVPRKMSNNDTKKLFNDVRKGMGLKEEKMFKNHIQLESVSDRREQYVNGSLYNLGDEVVIKESEQVATITVLGSNYVIVEDELGKRFRKWLDAIEPVSEKKLTPNEIKKREKVAKSIHRDDPNMPMDKKMAIATSVAKRTAENYSPQKYEWGKPESTAWAKSLTPGQNEDNTRTPQDPDIKDKKGTQPAKYFKGMSKATKNARDAHFKARKSGPAPGDGKKSTKVSPFTKYVKNLVGEVNVNVQKTKDRHADEIERNKARRDREMDRARSADTKLKNQQTEASFEDKAKKSGISVSTLKKVYKRGVAAHKTGHRPGTTPSQWGHARVNAFITKKKRGGLNHDKDLA